MKKLLIIMVLIMNVNAAATKDWYVGLGFFSGSDDSTVGSTTTTYDTGGADLKFGVIFKTNNRFEFSAININAKIGSGSDKTFKGRDFDWIFTPNLNNAKSPFLPFISAGFGLYKYDATSVDGYSVQAALGGYILASDALEVELSYKVKAIAWDTGSAASASESMKNFYVGLKYKF